MNVSRSPTVATTAVVVLGLAGCISLAPQEQTPSVVADVPDSFTTDGFMPVPVDSSLAGAYDSFEWWSVFADPQLNQVVDSALAANLDLVAAVARLDEVHAQLRATRGVKFPSISASANASKQDSPASAIPGAPADAGRFERTTYSASLGFAYELDLWGRIKNDTRAALGEALSTEADLHTVRIGVISETIAAYFEIADLRSRISLSVETLDILTERVAIAEDRYNRGLVSSFELYQLRSDYRNTQATLPDLRAQLADAEGRLAVLLGAYPGEVQVFLRDTMSPVLTFEPIPPSLPATLLEQRPDVRSAAYRMEAARYRVGARRAELFPSISLTGSAGSQATTLGDLINTIDQWTLNLAAGLTAPLFQGGRLRAQVDAARAQYTQLAASYAKTVLTAFQEAVSALAAYDEQQRRYAFFGAQLEEAEASAALQADRYRSGVAGYADYLDALRTVHQVRTARSAAGRQLALARLSVHRALGGGWTDGGRSPRFDMLTRP